MKKVRLCSTLVGKLITNYIITPNNVADNYPRYYPSSLRLKKKLFTKYQYIRLFISNKYFFNEYGYYGDDDYTPDGEILVDIELNKKQILILRDGIADVPELSFINEYLHRS